jgi:hypothetical protein
MNRLRRSATATRRRQRGRDPVLCIGVCAFTLRVYHEIVA